MNTMRSLYLFVFVLAFSSGLFAQYEVEKVYSEKCTYSKEDNLFYDNETGELCNCVDSIHLIIDSLTIPSDTTLFEINYFENGYLQKVESLYIGQLSNEVFYADNKVKDGAINMYFASVENDQLIISEDKLSMQIFYLNQKELCRFDYEYDSTETRIIESHSVSNDNDIPGKQWRVWVDYSYNNKIYQILYTLSDTTNGFIKLWEFNVENSVYLEYYKEEYYFEYPDSTRPPFYKNSAIYYSGDYVQFYENGKVKVRGVYTMEGVDFYEKDGIWYFYNKDGLVLKKEYYDRGELIKTEEFVEEEE